MKIIVGLGNPGNKYKGTRHNIGFMITGELASRHGINGKTESKFESIVGKGFIEGEEVLIVQPLTYMNLSGNAVVKVMNWYKAQPEDIFVVFDDISLELGRIRFRPSGSEGGHNGVASIIQSLGGFKAIPRLKVGIGPDPGGEMRKSYVLQEFTKQEKEMVDKIIPLSVEAIEFYLKEGMEKSMNKYNNTNLAHVNEET